MKKLLSILAITVLAGVSHAETLTIATGLPADSNHIIHTFFGYDTGTQKAWVQLQVGEAMDGDISWDKDQYIAVDGLRYDAQSKAVVYGQTVCGTADYWANYGLKNTGSCVVELVKDSNNKGSLVLTVNN